jgi:hypothetical protein
MPKNENYWHFLGIQQMKEFDYGGSKKSTFMEKE